MFGKGTCPLCECETNMLNKSGLKFENEYICSECCKKLIENGITIFSIKNHSLEELKDITLSLNPKNILACPHCKGHNIELLSSDKNYKTKYKTTVNLNPLKLFTLTNTKEIKKATAKEHNEYLCRDCGNRWIGT